MFWFFLCALVLTDPFLMELVFEKVGRGCGVCVCASVVASMMAQGCS